MSKPGGDPSSGISLGDVLRRPKRHPACRRREAQPGSWTERENLIGDAKGKGASWHVRAESALPPIATGQRDMPGGPSRATGPDILVNSCILLLPRVVSRVDVDDVNRPNGLNLEQR